MHKLLARQLKRVGASLAGHGPEVQKLLEVVDGAYQEADADRLLVERSLDLTSQELLERNRELSASEDRFRVLFDASPLSVLVFEVGTFRIGECNAAALKLYGYSRDELVEMKMTDLKAQPDDPELQRIAKNTSPTWRGTKSHRKKDGTTIDVDITAHPVMLDGRPSVLAMISDVTETRRLEEQLRQSQKMEAIGLLAGGIAHDFNNILAAMLVYADLALCALPESHPAAEDIRDIAKGAERASALTHQLLAFSRKQPWQPRRVTVNSVADGMGKMLRRVLGEDIKLATALTSVPWLVWADVGLIEQVLLNLAVNARDAMPNGGTLTLTTRNEVVDAQQARELEIEPGEHVIVSVADTGCGMDEATRARIFEPFFTTKGIGKGTGLGLATVFGIVKQCSGGIAVRSELGRGTEFIVYFPRTHGANSRPSMRATKAAGGSETILVVEDDNQVRKVVCRLLKDRGYRVLAASGAREALTILTSKEPVQLMLSDVVMPDIDGRKLAVSAKRLRSDLKVLFMSGYTQHPALDHTAFAEDEHLIQKPFTPQVLALAVRNVIDEPPQQKRA